MADRNDMGRFTVHQHALQFSFQSALRIFTALADTTEWMVRQRVEFVIHYLDDFLVITAADEHHGSHAMHLLLETFEHLGLPIVWDKLKGSSPCLTFLGFELDSICGEIRLPQQKLTDIRSEVHWWLYRKSCTKRARILSGLPISHQLSSKARKDIHAIPVQGTDGNPTGSPLCLPECLYSYGCLVVDHIYGRVEWGENDPTSMDTINRDLVRRAGVLIWVWSGMLVAIKVDTTPATRAT